VIHFLMPEGVDVLGFDYVHGRVVSNPVDGCLCRQTLIVPPGAPDCNRASVPNLASICEIVGYVFTGIGAVDR
jgi:hypothetical protein